MSALHLSIIVPVYNNAATLPELASRTEDALRGRVDTFELIFVDDGSRDKSWQGICELARRHTFVRGLRLSRNFGQHPAIAAGFEAARGQLVVLMDADLEDRPESIPLLIEAQRENRADIVYTIVATTAATRPRWTSRLFHQFFALAVRADVPQDIGTLRLLTRKMLDAVLSYREYQILFGPLMFFIGYDSAYIEVQRDAPPGRVSSYSFSKRLRLAKDSLISYTNLPSNLLLGAGAGILAAVTLYMVFILLQFVLGGPQAPPGVVLLSLLVLASLSINLFAFGVLGTYVFRVYQEVLQRPRYHIRDATHTSTALPKPTAARAALTPSLPLKDVSQ
jgi:polyisoprenyl-phosphate glycosyltransferase